MAAGELGILNIKSEAIENISRLRILHLKQSSPFFNLFSEKFSLQIYIASGYGAELPNTLPVIGASIPTPDGTRQYNPVSDIQIYTKMSQ